MKFPSITYLAEAYRQAIMRFPLPALVAIVATVCMMILIEENDSVTVFRILLSCTLGFPVLIAGVVMKERYAWSPAWFIGFNVLVLLLMAGYGYFLAPELKYTVYLKGMRYVLLLLASHLTVAFAGYLRSSNYGHFWEFNRQLFLQFLIGTFYALIIFAGLAVALLAADNLFDLDIKEELYGHLFVLVAGVFHTAYFLANFPKQYEYDLEESQYQLAVINLAKYVLIPLVILYFLILYAYASKIAITWELPKGWVSSLIIGFSVAGIFTYLLNYMLPQLHSGGLVQQYRKWFFYILVPMVVLLHIAIFKRIGDYGVTEPRYFVALTGFWLAGISLYFILSKKDDIRIIPITLTLLCVLCAFGPWGAFQMSKKSQENRLIGLLEKNGILVGEQLKKHVPPLKGDDAVQINSTLDYLRNRHYFEYIRKWSGVKADTTLRNNWLVISNLLDSMGVEKGYSYTDVQERYYYHSRRERSSDIAGYEKFQLITTNKNTDERSDTAFFEFKSSPPSIIYQVNGSAMESFDLRNKLDEWRKRNRTETDTYEPAELSIEFEGQRVRLKVVVNSAEVVWQEEKPMMQYLDAYVFFTEKLPVQE